MAKKTFVTMLVLLVASFAFSATIKYYRPSPPNRIDLSGFPMAKGEWKGHANAIEQGVIDILSPDGILEASYTGARGVETDLFISYFSGQNTQGGIHSPRNCLPGSGWTIEEAAPRNIAVGTFTIPASRMIVKYGQSRRIMDYWYITRYGATANDFRLKLYTMISALTFRPTDAAFIRFVAPDDDLGRAELDAFERDFVSEVYRFLPFGQTGLSQP